MIANQHEPHINHFHSQEPREQRCEYAEHSIKKFRVSAIQRRIDHENQTFFVVVKLTEIKVSNPGISEFEKTIFRTSTKMKSLNRGPKIKLKVVIDPWFSLVDFEFSL